MKADCGKILVLAVAAVMLLISPLSIKAVDKNEENIWSDEKPKLKSKRFELTNERIEYVMNWLKKTEPEKAKELAKLRQEDPEKFKAELRKVMRKQFGKKWREQKWQGAGSKFQRSKGMPFKGYGGYGGGARMSMHERYSEFLEWLKGNYPKETEELAELKEKNPGLYRKKLGLFLRMYRRIFEASKESPKLAEVLKEDLQLRKQRNSLLVKIRSEKNADEKSELIKKLQDVVSSRYDLIVRRKQIEYENLLKKLEKLKEQVKRSETQVDKWKDTKFKEDNVKARLEELISRMGRNKFKWD